MKELEDRILKDGRCLPGGILKVDNFINHQMDSWLMFQCAAEFMRLFADRKIDKILTIEASGIAPAVFAGDLMRVPVVFAKKGKSRNVSDSVYATQVTSFTHGNVNTVQVSKEHLLPGDRILILDDFLANGAALDGLIDLVEQAGAVVVGAGIAIEKAFQPGGARIRARGCRVESLARIAAMDPETGIRFC